MQWMENKRGVGYSHSASAHLSEQSTCSKFSRKKLRERKNADLHIIKDYAEENNNSLECLNRTHGRIKQLNVKLLHKLSLHRPIPYLWVCVGEEVMRMVERRKRQLYGSGSPSGAEEWSTPASREGQ